MNKLNGHDFDKYVAEVEPFVKKLIEKIYPLLTEHNLLKYDIETIPYDTIKNIELQKNGIDILITFENITCETKFRKHDYYDGNDILFETISVMEKYKPGWMYTCESEILLYCWWNKNKTNFMPRGYILHWEKLNKTIWFNELPDPNRYPLKTTTSRRGNQKWTTEFFCVPIEDFPQETIFRFNPTLDIQ